MSTISEFWRSGELGRKNVSKLKNHAKYGNCQNIFLTYHCDNYPLFQNSYFRFYCQQPVVLIIFGAYYSVELPDVSWIDFGKWATFQKRKWFSFKRCHQELQLANESVLDIHSSKSARTKIAKIRFFFDDILDFSKNPKIVKKKPSTVVSRFSKRKFSKLSRFSKLFQGDQFFMK